MSIERQDLPEDQWFDYEVRPAHGIVRKIMRDTQRASRSSDPLEPEDQLVLNLVHAWNVTTAEGESLPFEKASFDKVPQDIWSEIVGACTDVLEASVPNSRKREF